MLNESALQGRERCTTTRECQKRKLASSVKRTEVAGQGGMDAIQTKAIDAMVIYCLSWCYTNPDASWPLVSQLFRFPEQLWPRLRSHLFDFGDGNHNDLEFHVGFRSASGRICWLF